LARSRTAARSSAVNPLEVPPVPFLAGAFVPFVAGFFSAIGAHLHTSNESQPRDLPRDRTTSTSPASICSKVPSRSLVAGRI
jgi:hypothetical protein